MTASTPDPLRQMAEASSILRVPVGSTIHGLHVSGKDDHDEMGICIEPLDIFTRFEPFEQFIYRTADERAGNYIGRDRRRRRDAFSPKSMPGDLDLKIYSLRKYLRLALIGSPTDLIPLFVPADQCLVRKKLGAELQALTPLIVSRYVAERFNGYLRSQRERLLGERGQKDVQRPELEAAHGYDTKFAMHMLRIGYQGVEILTTGSLLFPMPEPSRSRCRDVRAGGVPLKEVVQETADLESQIVSLSSSSVLRQRPDVKRVERWMSDAYRSSWLIRLEII
jgi:hypothetical protein